MIKPQDREYLLNTNGYVTVMGIPGAGKSTLLNELEVPFRPEPTEDIETLGMSLSSTEWGQLVNNRFLGSDARPSAFWRDSDFFTSVGIFQGIDDLISVLPQISNRLIISETLIWLNLPMEQAVKNIISRNRRSAMMEIENTPRRFERAKLTFNLHPARRKVIMTPDKDNNYSIQVVF
jgi:hypothetical protein